MHSNAAEAPYPSNNTPHPTSLAFTALVSPSAVRMSYL